MNRKQLITKILDLSFDEFKTKEDFIELATESNWELIKRLKHIKNYYETETI